MTLCVCNVIDNEIHRSCFRGPASFAFFVVAKTDLYYFQETASRKTLQCGLNKLNPGLTQNFSKLKRDIAKLISVHDSIIILLSLIWYIAHSHSAMDGCTTINLYKTCQQCCCPSWRCLRIMVAFAGAFTTIIHQTAQTQNLDEDSFDMLYRDDF